jgi:cytochrome d ubiquinol oxidase subunit I
VHPFVALFENGYLWHELVHMYLAAYIVAGFVTGSVYGFAWLRGRRGRYEHAALTVALAAASLASLLQGVVGDWAGREVANNQPIKLAAFEGQGPTAKGAPEHILGWYSNGRVEYGIPIPRLLSALAYHDPNATVVGLDSVPAADRPPVNVVRIAFQTMVGIGTALAGLSVVFLYVWWRHRRLPESAWFWRAVVVAGPLSLVALIAGWVTTEVGRQPWVVYNVMRTQQAVTAASGVPVGYGTLVAIYIALGAAVCWALVRIARTPRDEEAADA